MTADPIPYGVHPRPSVTGWTLHVSAVPVAITAIDPLWPDDDVTFLNKLAGSFGYGFRQIDTTWRSCHMDENISGYVIALQAESTGAGLLTVDRVEVVPGPHGRQIVRSVISVGCRRLAEDVARDINASRTAMADAVAELLRQARLPLSNATQVREAWLVAAPTLAVHITTAPTQHNDLPVPVDFDAALMSETDRQVAQAIRSSGVQPGTYRGDAAKGLDRDELAPAALDVLTRRLSRHGMGDVILFGMQQLQCIVTDNDRFRRDIRQSAKLTLRWDPVTRYHEAQRQHLRLRLCAQVTVEAALRAGSSGNAPVDAVAWREILAAADAYIAATSRSEAIHHQVTPTALHISDAFEISVVPNGDGDADNSDGLQRYDFDLDAFGLAQAKIELANNSGLTDDSVGASGNTTNKPDVIAPELDAAMRTEYGVTATDLLAALLTLAAWPLQPDEPDLVAIEPQQIVDYLSERMILGDEPDGDASLRAAVSMLTSTSPDMKAADWRPWQARTRKRRLLIQPLPELSNGSLVVTPHWCLSSLSVYWNYLSQGQLPWSQPQPSRDVESALDAVRDARNKELERSVAKDLRDHGWSVINSIKKGDPQRLNVPSLSTEIDAVAGLAGLGTVWLLEVKDPVGTYVVPEIRRHLDRFFDTSKTSYVTQLRRKIADLDPHADQVARALGLPARPPSDPYVVKALFVTRKPVPAAFVSSDVEFVSSDELRSRLKAG